MLMTQPSGEKESIDTKKNVLMSVIRPKQPFIFESTTLFVGYLRFSKFLHKRTAPACRPRMNQPNF